jgi:hypothetical protein
MSQGGLLNFHQLNLTPWRVDLTKYGATAYKCLKSTYSNIPMNFKTLYFQIQKLF